MGVERASITKPFRQKAKMRIQLSQSHGNHRNKNKRVCPLGTILVRRFAFVRQKYSRFADSYHPKISHLASHRSNNTITRKVAKHVLRILMLYFLLEIIIQLGGDSHNRMNPE